jgi:hypothetical protein
MKKIPVATLVVLIMIMISSSGYCQDTTDIAQSQPAGQSLVAKKKTASQWEYSVNFSGRKVAGYTDYHIKFPATIYFYDGSTYIPYTVPGHSILAFPIDGYRMEGVVTGKLRLPKNKALIFDLGFSTTISQPQEAMVDSDYIELKDFGWSNWVLGATRSSVDYSNYDISLNAGYTMLLGKKAQFIPMIGFQTSMNKFDVIGLEGWYEWDYGIREPVDPYYYAGTTVMKYEVTYNRIVTGAQIKTTGEEGVFLTLQAQYFPWVKATDHDDHLLRGKEADTAASGTGYSLEGRIEIPVHTTSTGSIWSVGGGYELLRMTATGSQQQRYYADNPLTAEVETQYIFDPIDNTLKLRQNNIIAFIKYKL